MPLQSTILFEVPGGSTIANELNYPNHSDFGATIFAWKVRMWRGGAIAIPLDGWDNTPIYIGIISSEANNFSWMPLVTKDEIYTSNASDLPDLTSLIESHQTWNKPFMFGLDWTSSLSPNGNSTVGIGIRGVIWGFTLNGGIYFANGDNPQWTEIVKPQQ